MNPCKDLEGSVIWSFILRGALCLNVGTWDSSEAALWCVMSLPSNSSSFLSCLCLVLPQSSASGYSNRDRCSLWVKRLEGSLCRQQEQAQICRSLSLWNLSRTWRDYELKSGSVLPSHRLVPPWGEDGQCAKLHSQGTEGWWVISQGSQQKRPIFPYYFLPSMAFTLLGLQKYRFSPGWPCVCTCDIRRK